VTHENFINAASLSWHLAVQAQFVWLHEEQELAIGSINSGCL